MEDETVSVDGDGHGDGAVHPRHEVVVGGLRHADCFDIRDLAVKHHVLIVMFCVIHIMIKQM